MKTEVYSWRLSSELKSDLERAAFIASDLRAIINSSLLLLHLLHPMVSLGRHPPYPRLYHLFYVIRRVPLVVALLLPIDVNLLNP